MISFSYKSLFFVLDLGFKTFEKKSFFFFCFRFCVVEGGFFFCDLFFLVWIGVCVFLYIGCLNVESRRVVRFFGFFLSRDQEVCETRENRGRVGSCLRVL